MRAFGYTPTNEVDDREAAIVRELANRVLLGEPLQALVNDLHTRRIPTSNGGQWDRVTIRQMLRNPRIAGKPFGTRSRTVPAILPTEVHDRIVELLDAPGRRVNMVPSHRQYLMAGGRLICGRCDKPMGPKGGAMPAYCCVSRYPTNGCGRMRIVADKTDVAVTAMVLARLALPETREQIRVGLEMKQGGPTRMSKLRADIATAKEAGDGAKVSELSEQLDLELASWTPVANMKDYFGDLLTLTPRGLAQWWHLHGIEMRQTVLAHMLEAVKVLPVGRIGRYAGDSIGERLEYVWR